MSRYKPGDWVEKPWNPLEPESWDFGMVNGGQEIRWSGDGFSSPLPDDAEPWTGARSAESRGRLGAADEELRLLREAVGRFPDRRVSRLFQALDHQITEIGVYPDAWKPSQPCGHSVCSQHFIETGLRGCIESEVAP